MAEEPTWLAQARAQVERLTPRAGFNVVAVDSYEPPGENLYLVGHFVDEAAAAQAATAHEARSGDKAYVYRSA